MGPGDAFEVPQDPLPLAGRGRIVRVRHLRGEGRFLGNAKIAPVGGDGYFPLARPAWIEEQPGNLVSVASTEEALSGGGQSGGLSLYHRVVCQALVFARKMAEAKDRARLTARAVRGRCAARCLAPALDRSLGAWRRNRFAARVRQSSAQSLSSHWGGARDIVSSSAGYDPRHAHARSRGRAVQKFRARCRRVALDESCYRREGQPLLAYRESDRRPLALLPRRSLGYYVYDPVDGSRTKARRGLVNSLEPFAYGFYRAFPPKPIGLKDLCLFGLSGSWANVALVFLMALLVGLLGMVFPILTRYVFDEIIPSAYCATG